jgi:hypothetical protein
MPAAVETLPLDCGYSALRVRKTEKGRLLNPRTYVTSEACVLSLPGPVSDAGGMTKCEQHEVISFQTQSR